MLLHDELFFKGLFYGHYARQLGLTQEKNTLACIQILIAWGLQKFALSHDDMQELFSVDDYCSLSNCFYQQLDLETCVFYFSFQLLSSRELTHYLAYVKTTSSLEELERYKAHLLFLEDKEQKGKLLPCFEKQIADSLVTITTWMNKTTQLYPTLSECPCNGHERTDRKQLEDELIKQALNRYPPETTARLDYLSLGSGQLLQDFIILLQLLKAGYSNLRVSLIDPHVGKDASSQFAWLTRIARERNAQITIDEYTSLRNYKEATQAGKAHLIVCIDFENIFQSEVFDEVMQAQALLADNGFFLFSYDQHKLAMTQHTAGLLLPLTSEQVRFQETFRKLRFDPRLAKAQINVAISGQTYLFEQWLYLLPLLNQASVETITLYLERPKKQNYFYYPTDKNNNGFNEENLSQFLSLSTQKSVHVIFAEPEALTKDGHNKLDIMTSLALEGKSLSELYQQADDMKTRFQQALCYVAAVYQNEMPLILSQGNTLAYHDARDEITQTLFSLLNHLDTYLIPTPSSGELSFFDRPKANVDLIRAIERAKLSCDELILSDSKELIRHFLLAEIEEKESVYGVLGRYKSWFSLPSLIAGPNQLQQRLLDFVKEEFGSKLIIPSLAERVKQGLGIQSGSTNISTQYPGTFFSPASTSGSSRAASSVPSDVCP